MQIILNIEEDEFDINLRKKIDMVMNLNEYIKILPKSIVINTADYFEISFIKKL